MSKRKTIQAVAGETEKAERADSKPLTWNEERFVDEYVRTGNGAQAYLRAQYKNTANPAQRAHDLRTIPYIAKAIEDEKDRIRVALKYDRETYFRQLIAIALATIDDFAPVFKDPSDRANYRGLKDLRYAIEEATCIETESAEGTKITTRIKLIKRMDALDRLRDGLNLLQSKGDDGFKIEAAELLRLVQSAIDPSSK